MSSSPRRRTTVLLLGLSLLTSAIHFADNAWHFDLYPGPIWLTSRDVLLAWCVLPPLAWAAYRVGTRGALIAYALLGFVGFAHFLMPHAHTLRLRCLITIFAEAATSTALIASTLLRPANPFGNNSEASRPHGKR